MPPLTALWPVAKVVLLGGITGAGLLGTMFSDWKEDRARQKAIAEQTQQALIVASQEQTEVNQERFTAFQKECDASRKDYRELVQGIDQELAEALDTIPPVREGGIPCPKDCLVP